MLSKASDAMRGLAMMRPRCDHQLRIRRQCQTSTARDPLIGRILPKVLLDGWPDGPVNLSRWTSGPSVIVSTYPGTWRRPGGPQRNTARIRAWERHEREFRERRYDVAFLSACPLEWQHEWVTNVSSAVTLLSDVDMRLAGALPIPTLETEEGRVYDDLTFIATNREITQVFYASREPPNDVDTVMRFLRAIHG